MDPALFYPLETSGTEYQGEATFPLSIVEAGTLHAPSGAVVVCDPFAYFVGLGRGLMYDIPAGDYPVRVTVAHPPAKEAVNAYLSIVFADAEVTSVEQILPHLDLDEIPMPGVSGYSGVSVDSGSVAVLDAAAAKAFAADTDVDTFTDYIHSDAPDGWFNLLRDPAHHRKDIANITLPDAKDAENMVLARSGWDSGLYPVIASYDRQRNLVALHIDFMVVGGYPYN